MKKTPSGFCNSRNTSLCAFCIKLILPLSLIVIFLLCAHLIPASLTYEYTAADKSTFRASEQITAPENSMYVIRASGEKIGIFDASGTHIKNIDINIRELPEYDRKLLSEGIIADKDELSELIEALLS